MRDFLKSLYFAVIQFAQTLVTLIVIAAVNKIGISRKIGLLRKTVKDRPVSILSGGPSAKEVLSERQDLLEGTDLLVLNFFGNTDYFFQYKPSYYVLLDPSFCNVNYVNKGLNENETNESRTQEMLLVDNLNRVDWPLILFVPYQKGGGRVAGSAIDNPNIKMIQYHGTRIMGFNWFQNMMYRHNQGLPSSRNVIIPSMILMANIGYKKMYLYGCEFSWTKTMDVDLKNGRMYFNDKHFYSEEEIRYFGKGAYLWWLDGISEMLHGVEQVAQYAQKIGAHIVNRTKGSFIDCFDYENPDTIEKRL